MCWEKRRCSHNDGDYYITSNYTKCTEKKENSRIKKSIAKFN